MGAIESRKTDKYFLNTGLNEIKTNISHYVAAFKNGQDVVMSSLYGEIYKVSGVRNVSYMGIKESTDSEYYTTDRFNINNRQVARIPSENIEITVDNYVDQ